MMFRVVLAQVLASVAVAIAAAAIAGSHAAATSLLGGLACALPNAFFALNLALLGQWRGSQGGRNGSAAAVALPILIGEFCKLALTIGLLALLVWVYRDVVWPALIVSVGAVLLVQPFALAWRHDGR